MNNRPLRRKIIIYASIVVVFFVIYKLAASELAKVELTISSNNLTSITLARSVSDGHDFNVGKDITTIGAGQVKSIRLKKDVYFIKFHESEETANFEEELTIDSKRTIEAPALELKEDALKSLLEKESSKINETLSTNKIFDNYSLANNKLYARGEWFGADLINKNTLDDNRKIIMKKENAFWKIAAGPEIILSIRSYPNVPETIIRPVNNTK